MAKKLNGGIYTASRTRHAELWREARADGVPVNSTWIDEAGEGETKSMSELWCRCIEEAQAADALIVYREDGEPLKGALVEVGAALGANKPVYAVGFDAPEDLKAFSFLNHPNVKRCLYIGFAFAHARADFDVREGRAK